MSFTSFQTDGYVPVKITLWRYLYLLILWDKDIHSNIEIRIQS